MSIQELKAKKALLTEWIHDPSVDEGDVDAWNKHSILVESWQKSVRLIDAEIKHRQEKGVETR
jgi:hypothetical protein